MAKAAVSQRDWPVALDRLRNMQRNQLTVWCATNHRLISFVEEMSVSHGSLRGHVDHSP